MEKIDRKLTKAKGKSMKFAWGLKEWVMKKMVSQMTNEVEGKAPRDVWTMATLDRAYIEAAG